MRITNNTNSTSPAHSVNNVNEEMTQRRPLTTDVPFYSGPAYRPPPKPIRSPMEGSHEGSQSSNSVESTEIDSGINIDFKENFLFKEGVISETYQRPGKSFFQKSQTLQTLVNTGNQVQKFLPKQADIDKILKVIQRNLLKGTHLPVDIKEIQAGYLNSPYFKDMYLYLAQKRLPSTKVVIIKVEFLAERYVLLDFLLFKITPTTEK